MASTETLDVVASTRAVIDPVETLIESADHRAMVRDAVDKGHIVVSPAEVKIRKANSPTKQDEVQPYLAYNPVNVAGMVALCAGKVEPKTAKPEEGKDERTPQDKAYGVCDFFTYGYDLDIRQSIRLGLEDSLAGPEKAIGQAVKGLLQGGLFTSDAEAREFVIKGRQAKGLPV